MDEYVTKEKVLAQLERCARDPYHETHYIRDAVINTIRRMEAADVVEVVRCGDCLFCQMELYDGADEPWCDVHNKTVDAEAFCSWGERKSDG